MTETKAASGQETLVVEDDDEAAVSQRRLLLMPGERGMVSAEWAVGIIAAIAIAGVLLAVVTNGRVEDALLGYILDLIRGFARAGS